MNFKKLLGIILLASFLGCKNDIDINAPYKDMAVVYAFLDQNQPVQYLRIQKLYQNSFDVDTYTGAQHPDSLYFDTLVVKLTNTLDNKVYTCYRVDTIPKNSGFFTSGKNTLYAVSLPKNNASNEQYLLNIFYPKKNLLFTSSTYLVKDAIIPFRRIILKYDTIAKHTFGFKFSTGGNSALYDLTVRFSYKEMNAADTSKYTIKNVDYIVTRSTAYLAGKEYTVNIGTVSYINYLKSQIPADNTKIRKTIGLIYQTYGGSKEFQNLLDLSRPSLTIVQNNPIYSNIEPKDKAIGIFSSRNFGEKMMDLDPNSITVLAQQLPNFTE